MKVAYETERMPPRTAESLGSPFLKKSSSLVDDVRYISSFKETTVHLARQSCVDSTLLHGN